MKEPRLLTHAQWSALVEAVSRTRQDLYDAALAVSRSEDPERWDRLEAAAQAFGEAERAYQDRQAEHDRALARTKELAERHAPRRTP